MCLLYFTFMDCTLIITQTTFLALLPKLRRKFNKTNRKREAEETIQWRQKEQNKTRENDQASEGWIQRNPEKVMQEVSFSEMSLQQQKMVLSSLDSPDVLEACMSENIGVYSYCVGLSQWQWLLHPLESTCILSACDLAREEEPSTHCTSVGSGFHPDT